MHWKSPQSPRKKKARMRKSKFKAMMIVFSISGGLSTLIGCLEVRLSIRFIIKMFWRPSVNVCYEGDQTCGRMPHDSPSWQRASTQRAICEEVFGEKQHSSDGTSTVLSGPSIVRHFSLPENQVCAQRNQVRVRGFSESKSDATLEQINTRWPAALLQTVENSHGAV